jgi:hypothetical protein
MNWVIFATVLLSGACGGLDLVGEEEEIASFTDAVIGSVADHDPVTRAKQAPAAEPTESVVAKSSKSDQDAELVMAIGLLDEAFVKISGLARHVPHSGGNLADIPENYKKSLITQTEHYVDKFILIRKLSNGHAECILENLRAWENSNLKTNERTAATWLLR